MLSLSGSSPSTILLNPVSNSRSLNMGFPPGPVHSNITLSLSNIIGEISVADYQDCGLSTFYLRCSYWPIARGVHFGRFGKQIRYASRKARADTRKRVKGRFGKADEAYEYDPLVTKNQ
ncbi:hypothetical protein NMG60_11035469 [Bertholletia excelsa]